MGQADQGLDALIDAGEESEGHQRQVGHNAVGRHPQDGLDGQVAVVGQVPGEVIGAQLVLRVQTVAPQVVGPGGQQVPRLVGEAHVPAGHSGGGGHQEHVAALLHRHLVLGVGAVGIHLPVEKGELAGVVGGKVKGPLRAGGVTGQGRIMPKTSWGQYRRNRGMEGSSHPLWRRSRWRSTPSR